MNKKVENILQEYKDFSTDYWSEQKFSPDIWFEIADKVMNYTQTKDLCVSRFIDFSNENASPCFCFKSNLRPTTRLN